MERRKNIFYQSGIGLSLLFFFLLGTGCGADYFVGSENGTLAPYPTSASGEVASPAANPSTPSRYSASCYEGSCFYQDKIRQFALTYPETWQMREGILGTAVTILSPLKNSDDHFAESLNVITEEVSPTTTLDGYYTASEENIKNYFSRFKLLKNEPATVGSYPGRMLVYQLSQGSVHLRTTQFFVLKDGRAYIITLTNLQSEPNTLLKEMTAMAKSFQFVK